MCFIHSSECVYKSFIIRCIAKRLEKKEEKKQREGEKDEKQTNKQYHVRVCLQK